MNHLIIALTTILVSFTRFSLDTESPEERLARMQSTAQYLVDAADRATCTGAWSQVEGCRRIWPGNKRDLLAASTALGMHETHYAQAVYEGRCHELPKGMRCDNGNARTYWQQWRVACPEAWSTEPGSEDEVKAGAWCAMRLLASAYRMCEGETEDNWAAAFRKYGGHSCRSRGAEDRVATMRRVLTKL